MPKVYSKRSILFLSGVFLFFAFVAFSYLVKRTHFTSVDFDTTVRLQEHISRRFDTLFSTLSEVGKVEVMSIVLLVVLIFARKIVAGIVSVLLYVGFHVIEIYGKFFVNHPPPPQFMLRTQHLVDFPQFHVRSENSYPSGHAGRAAFVSIILGVLVFENQRFSKTTKTILLAVIIGYDIVMFVSRIYLGEHWMSDVIGGAILGAGLGLISSGLLVKNSK